jgi:hypothetical protein
MALGQLFWMVPLEKAAIQIYSAIKKKKNLPIFRNDGN